MYKGLFLADDGGRTHEKTPPDTAKPIKIYITP